MRRCTATIFVRRADGVTSRRVILLVNTDAFFVSHRLALGCMLRDAGYEVVVAASESGARRTIEREGLRFVPMPFEPGGRSPVTEARTIAAIRELYSRERPDIVHHVTIKPVLYGSVVARALRVPAIVNAVSGLGYVFIDRAEPSVRHRALQRGVLAAYRIALGARRSRTIFQNPDDRDMFVARGLVRRERTALIPGSGVDLSRFVSTPLPEGAPVVVLPARMLWDKGVGELVEAARQLRAKHPTARFLLAGGAGSQNPAVVEEKQLLAWQREGVIEWIGHQTDMPGLFSRAHLVVLPSYREGSPLALAEAAASGRAAITTDVPGCRDVVRDGETGWLVPARDAGALARAIDVALSDRVELQRRGKNARAQAEERFSIEAILRATRDVYAGLFADE